MPKTTQQFNEQYEKYCNRKWVGPKSYSCYLMVKEFYRDEYGYNMRTPEQWHKLKIFSFTDQSVLLEGGEYIYRKDWGDEMDFTQLQKDDILLFKLYDTPLGGGYSAPKDRAPNHGAIYLGDGHMLHHPYGEYSKITNLMLPGFNLYTTSCLGAVRITQRTT